MLFWRALLGVGEASYGVVAPALLAANTLVMCLVVVLFNRTVWQPCYRLAEERYSLNK